MSSAKFSVSMVGASNEYTTVIVGSSSLVSPSPSESMPSSCVGSSVSSSASLVPSSSLSQWTVPWLMIWVPFTRQGFMVVWKLSATLLSEGIVPSQ